jgi:transcriptional regulator with XRE-family HTH domain
MHFGELLAGLRKEAGLTQVGLAGRAGLSSRTVQSWEQGRRAPVSPDFFRLVEALGVSADAFAGITPPDKARPSRKPRKRK